MTLGKIAIIGCGKAASSLGPSIKKAGADLAFLFDRNLSKAVELANTCSATVCANLEDINQADTILLAVPDDAITEACQALPFDLTGKNVLHLSGSRPLSLLDDALHRGAKIGCWHPAQTLGGLVEFEDVCFGITAEGILREDLFRLSLAMGAHPIYVSPEQKVLYHLAATVSSNYVCTLQFMGQDLLIKAGFTTNDAQAILLPLLKQTIENISLQGPQKALTGPVSRGDTLTVKEHIHFLSQRAPHYLPLYVQAGLITVDIANTFNAPLKMLLQKVLEEA